MKTQTKTLTLNPAQFEILSNIEINRRLDARLQTLAAEKYEEEKEYFNGRSDTASLELPVNIYNHFQVLKANGLFKNK